MGTNDINNRDSLKSLQFLGNLRKIAVKCFSYGKENVLFSSVAYKKRSNGCFRERVNPRIAKFYKENNYSFIDHIAISAVAIYMTMVCIYWIWVRLFLQTMSLIV